MQTPIESTEIRIFDETIGGALIDSARISVMAAIRAFPSEPTIVLPGEEDQPAVSDCLIQAMQWLDAARALTLERSGTAPTSLHFVAEGGGS